MKDFTDCRRTFYHVGAAYYARTALEGADYTDEVMVSMAANGGGTRGEFAMRWYVVSGKPTPRLESFSDSWAALTQFGDLLAALAELDDPVAFGRSRAGNLTPAQFVELLKRLGIEDRTPYTRD